MESCKIIFIIFHFSLNTWIFRLTVLPGVTFVVSQR